MSDLLAVLERIATALEGQRVDENAASERSAQQMAGMAEAAEHNAAVQERALKVSEEHLKLHREAWERAHPDREPWPMPGAQSATN